MRINESLALVSGANRGIGRAFVEALLELGATRIYAARDLATLEPIARRDRPRVRTIKLDVKDPADSPAAVEEAKDVNLLVNNGAVATIGGLADTSLDAIREHMETSFVGAWNLTRRSSPCSSAMRLPSFP